MCTTGEETRLLLLWFVLALFGVGCNRPSVVVDAAAPVEQGAAAAIVYEPCTAICLRPADCQRAFPDGDVCPPGFLCSLRFTCALDGGAGD